MAGEEQKSDDELMRALQSGDIDAFEELVRRYRAPLAAFVTQMLDDKELAEDFVQETFLRVYRSGADYIPMGHFRGWLYTIARHLCLNSLSHAQRHLGLSPDAPMVLWTWPEHIPAPEPDERGELRQEIEEAAGRLPEKQRRVLLLRFYHGLTLEEIAEVEGCPLGTVKSRLHHALRRMRQKLRRPGDAKAPGQHPGPGLPRRGRPERGS